MPTEGRTPIPKTVSPGQAKTPEPSPVKTTPRAPPTVKITPRATSVMSINSSTVKIDPVKSASTCKPEKLSVSNPEQPKLKLFKTVNIQGAEASGTSQSTERRFIARPIPNPTPQNKLAMLAATVPSKNSCTGATSEVRKKITPVPIKMTQIKLQASDVTFPRLSSPMDEKRGCEK